MKRKIWFYAFCLTLAALPLGYEIYKNRGAQKPKTFTKEMLLPSIDDKNLDHYVFIVEKLPDGTGYIFRQIDISTLQADKEGGITSNVYTETDYAFNNSSQVYLTAKSANDGVSFSSDILPNLVFKSACTETLFDREQMSTGSANVTDGTNNISVNHIGWVRSDPTGHIGIGTLGDVAGPPAKTTGGTSGGETIIGHLDLTINDSTLNVNGDLTNLQLIR